MNGDKKDINVVLYTLDECLLACAKERVCGNEDLAKFLFHEAFVIARTLEWLGIKTFKRNKGSKNSLFAVIDNKVQRYVDLIKECGNGQLEHSDEEA